jgi:hypothetical protein
MRWFRCCCGGAAALLLVASCSSRARAQAGLLDWFYSFYSSGTGFVEINTGLSANHFTSVTVNQVPVVGVSGKGSYLYSHLVGQYRVESGSGRLLCSVIIARDRVTRISIHDSRCVCDRTESVSEPPVCLH